LRLQTRLVFDGYERIARGRQRAEALEPGSFVTVLLDGLGERRKLIFFLTRAAAPNARIVGREPEQT